MKKITKKRIKAISKKVVSQIKATTDIKRIKTLHKRAIKINFIQNREFNDSFDMKNFKPMSITLLLKKMPWYKDQKIYRQDLIVGHRDFFCPISKQILDMNDSFILKLKGQHHIVSSKGVDIALEKNPDYLGLIVT